MPPIFELPYLMFERPPCVIAAADDDRNFVHGLEDEPHAVAPVRHSAHGDPGDVRLLAHTRASSGSQASSHV